MKQIVDTYGRVANYLRLAVTDRCNMRCTYCMPESGVPFLPKQDILTYEEMLLLARALCDLGVHKIRITGGEPFVRRDLMYFLRALRQTPGLHTLHITTNGSLIEPFIDDLVDLPLDSINLSIDSLDATRFANTTRSSYFDRVRQNLRALLETPLPININAVVIRGLSHEDLQPMVDLVSEADVTVRFIEEMPFNGRGKLGQDAAWDHLRIRQAIEAMIGPMENGHSTDTAAIYTSPVLRGRIGIIPAWSRTFCGTCNRIRITPDGTLKTCLYDSGPFNLKTFLRAGASMTDIQDIVLEAFQFKARDGRQAEALRKDMPIRESMTTIGG